MRLRKTHMAALMGIVALAAAACGGSSSTSSSTTSAAASSGSAAASTGATSGGGGGSELVIWADNSANTANAIEPLCVKWAQDNGVTCTVKKFNGGDDLKKALIAGNSTGDVPDLFEGPHDTIGQLITNGILAPVDLASNKSKFQDIAVKAVTLNGSTYGVPWAVENVALLTNKALSPTCPATLDEAVANAKTLIAAGTATSGLGIAMQIGETGDAYHWNPLYTSDGGYTFKQGPDGSYDTSDMGVGKEGSIAAGVRLQQLVNDGILKASVSYDIAKESFSKGTSPFFITGPWQIPDQKTALGANLMVCPVPNWAGSSFQAQPDMGVRTFMQPAKAKNAVLASTFLNDEVMTTEFMDGMFAVDPRPPAWIESYDKAASDPYIKAFGDYGKLGEPIPAIQQMAFVFTDLGLAEYKIASGADPTTTMTEAQASINKQIAGS